MNRRALLRTLGTAGMVGLAGCSTRNGADTPTDTTDPTESQQTTDTPEDITAPVIDDFTAQYTDTADDIAIYLEGHDDEALDAARITTPADEITRRPDDTAVTVEATMVGAPGRMNTVTARLQDATGNVTEREVETYVRKYTPLDGENTFGVSYIPWMGRKWRCIAADDISPAIGRYDDRQPEVMNRHLDQLLGHGIDPVLLLYNGKKPTRRDARAFMEPSLASELAVEPNYIIGHALKWSDDTPEQLRNDVAFIRDTFLQRGNPGTHDGRPVINLWGTRTLSYVEWAGTDKGDDPFAVAHEWEGVSDFIDFFRSELTVDGQEPYIIGEFRHHGVGGVPDVVDEEAIDWAGQFTMGDDLEAVAREMDAITNWTGFQYNGRTTPWDVTYEVTHLNFEGLSQFAAANDLDFVPRVYPGFDDRHNTCWGADRHVPRSPDHLAQLLDLAQEYQTIDRVYGPAYNDWTEGHQIEPGTFKGTDYGTAYLEVIEEFQRGDG